MYAMASRGGATASWGKGVNAKEGMTPTTQKNQAGTHIDPVLLGRQEGQGEYKVIKLSS